MTYINPYISFNGKCREAMTFYKECIGGELSIQTIGESPMAGKMPNASDSDVMHSSLMKDGKALLLASDMGPDNLEVGNVLSITLNCDSEQEIRLVFEKLSQGGTVKSELQEQFWGAIYGEVFDKYGIKWLLNYQKVKQ